MVSLESLQKIALSFPETNEVPHFEKISFRYKKKIFATYNNKENRACLKLSPVDQDVFSAFNREMIHPVPNKWGKYGWTLFYFAQLNEELFADALEIAYQEVVNK